VAGPGAFVTVETAVELGGAAFEEAPGDDPPQPAATKLTAATSAGVSRSLHRP
jgi:hypothetical protein